jgi:hypothetical protein
LPLQHTWPNENVFLVISAAVKKWSERATDHDIGRAVADQLKHAPGRSGGGGKNN